MANEPHCIGSCILVDSLFDPGFAPMIVALRCAIGKTVRGSAGGLPAPPGTKITGDGGGRMRFWVGCGLFACLLPVAAECATAPNVEAGKIVFVKCALCHTNEPGKNKIGPSLFGIVGRKSASLPNYNYSEAMKNFHHTWDAKTLDTYLADPRAVVPGTKMIFPGIKDETQRENLIAYLETLK
jgi:cytochrome c